MNTRVAELMRTQLACINNVITYMVDGPSKTTLQQSVDCLAVMIAGEEYRQPHYQKVLNNIKYRPVGYKPDDDQPIGYLHLCANRDVMGNPRRLYLILNSVGSIIGVRDEGYDSARPALPCFGSFHIKVNEYRSYLREFPKF